MIHLRRTQETINRNHRDRLRNLERATPPDQPQIIEVARFSVVGDMEVITSGEWDVEMGGQITAVKFNATGAGSGTTTFDVLLNGVALGSGVSVAAATLEQTDYLGNYRAAHGDKLRWDITGAGMHEHATLKVVMKGPG